MYAEASQIYVVTQRAETRESQYTNTEVQNNLFQYEKQY